MLFFSQSPFPEQDSDLAGQDPLPGEQTQVRQGVSPGAEQGDAGQCRCSGPSPSSAL